MLHKSLKSNINSLNKIQSDINSLDNTKCNSDLEFEDFLASLNMIDNSETRENMLIEKLKQIYEVNTKVKSEILKYHKQIEKLELKQSKCEQEFNEAQTPIPFLRILNHCFKIIQPLFETNFAYSGKNVRLNNK